MAAPAPDPVAAVPDPVAAPAPDPVAAVPDPVAAPAPDPVAAVPHPVAALGPTAVAPVSDVSALIQDMLTSVAGAAVPRTQLQSDLYSFLMRSDVSALIQDMLTSVAGAVVPLTQLQSDLYSFLMSSDVSALIQDMLTSVAGGVVPLTQLQSDLYSFLVGIAGMDPVVAAVTLNWIQSNLGGVAGAGLSPAADASVASLSRLALLFARIPGGAVGRQRNRDCTARGDRGVHFHRDDPGR